MATTRVQQIMQGRPPGGRCTSDRLLWKIFNLQYSNSAHVIMTPNVPHSQMCRKEARFTGWSRVKELAKLSTMKGSVGNQNIIEPKENYAEL